jgi:hypothetical protein
MWRGLIRFAETIFEYPMVDKDPVDGGASAA